MIIRVINIIYKIKLKLGLIKSHDFLKHLRDAGAEIGDKVFVFDVKSVTIDSTRPWLLKIGNYTKITKGVVILTHDYSLSVLRRVYGEWIGEGGATVIGENCFLGMNSIILKGTHIGNNCIIGAGAVVSGNFPDNVVIAGNPAKIIKTLDQHYESRKNKTLAEAVETINMYRSAYKKEPSHKDLAGFKFLFEPRDDKILKKDGLDNFYCNGDEPEEVKNAFFSTKPIFDSFDALLQYSKINDTKYCDKAEKDG